jgi:HD-GYP domain-containing protein (c-di-GMP phosphodiesterase class II)
MSEIERLERELADLNAIGIGLTAEAEPARVLETILRKAREITRSDAGSLYLVEDGTAGRCLRFALTQNDSRPVPFHASTLPLTDASVAGYVALEGRPVTLEDAYHIPPGSRFTVNTAYDAQTSYRTKSMLAVPMRSPHGEILGVVQLINAKPSGTTTLGAPEEIERVVEPYSARSVQLASSLASQAAAALLNSRLYDDIRRLFSGFVAASVSAIEARDPATAGHSFRVAGFTVALAEAVSRTSSGPFARVTIDADHLTQLRYAALLHDFGKVGVREHVLGKATKLLPHELERVLARIERMRAETELRASDAKLQYLLVHAREDFDAFARSIDAERDGTSAALEACRARVIRLNEPGLTADGVAAAVAELRALRFPDRAGARQAVVTEDEARSLAITRGTLTGQEIFEIRSHVVHTYEFLSRIPWTAEFRHVPELARDHHERLDGSGYPRGLAGEAIPLGARMMMIADVYDALTAIDRPYKPAMSRERALALLDAERRAGLLDGALLDVFLDEKIYEAAR